MYFKSFPLSALFLVFGVIHSVLAQKPIDYRDYARIGGQVVDAETGEPLPYVQINNIYKHPKKDSIVVNISITDAEGKFIITTPRVVENRIEAVCMGYKLFERAITEIKTGILQDPVAMAKIISLGKLKMEPDVQQLDEVVVRSRIRLYEMHGDTAYIFPKLIKVGKGEPLIELLRRHPMFDVKENGDVYFDGKRIERVKLNEKLLFGEDARTAVTSLLAEDAQLIKAYDEVDEEDEIMRGSERARKRKVLDIVSFRNFNEIRDAEMVLEGGWDKEKNMEGKYKEHYFAGITGGIYNDQTRMSFQATLDNFPGKRNRGNKLRHLLGGSDSYNRNGEGKFSIEKSSSDLLKRFSVDYLYRNQYSDNQNNFINEYYPDSSFDRQFQENVTQSSRDSKRHSLNFNGKFIQKQNHSIDFNLAAYLFDTEQENFNFNRMIRDSELLSFVERQNQSDSKRYSLGTRLDYKQKINKLGSINFYLNASIGKSKGNTIRTDSTLSFGISNYKILDMNSKSPMKELLTSLFFSPALNLFTLRSDLTYRDQDVHRMYINRSTGLVDSLMSENVSERSLQIRNEMDFEIYKGNKHMLYLGVSYSIIKLWRNERFPKFWNEQMTFHLLNPKIFYVGTFGQIRADLLLKIGQELIPSWNIADFSTRLNIDDPLFVRGGNPNLKLPNRHELSLTLTLPHRLRISLKDTYVQNGVVLSNTLFPESTYLPEYNYQMLAGATLQKPINIDGYHELNSSLDYSKMFGLVLSMRTSLGYAFRNPQAEYNGRLGRVKDHTGNWNLTLNSNFSSTLFLTLRNQMGMNWYTNADGLTTKRFTNAISLNANWEITYRFFIKSDYTYRHQNNSALDYDINEQVLNASIGLKLFKNYRGKLTFSAYDILNNRKNITTVANDMYIQTKHTFLNTSYFAVSFEYRLTNQ